MRRILPACLLAVALLAGCGSDEKPASTADTTDGTTADTTDGSAATTAVQNADCPVPDTVPVPSFPDGKPSVEIPDELPTELVITDLIEGSGPAAVAGDTVVVNYVGVRSEDGTEFDNSYDRGSPYPVTNLGSASVIEGWNQGLIGIKAGGRRQLDIPADLAYGDNPQPGSAIQAGDALTFVVDAISVGAVPVVPTASAGDQPDVKIPTSVGATKVTKEDLVAGDPCQIAAAGQTAYLQIVAYRGDNAEEIQSTYAVGGQAAAIGLDDGSIPGIVEGVIGMGVGGRRLIVIPFADAFGEAGDEGMGLPPSTDIILVVDLVQLG